MKTLFSLSILATLCLTTYAQNCKYSKNSIDEFTNNREVASEWRELYQENNRLTFVLSLDDTPTSYKISVRAGNSNGINNIHFNIACCECAKNELFTQIDLLLENGKVINLKGQSESLMRDDCTHCWRYYYPSDTEWQLLKTHALKKLRVHLYNNTNLTIDIKEKSVNHIKEIISCIDALNIPTSKPKEKIEDNKPEVINTFQPKVETIDIPQRTGDTNSVSLYKQWTVITTIEKDGSLGNENYILRLFADGTYNQFILLENNHVNKIDGKFQLLASNKVIVFTPDKGNSTSFEIVNLTNRKLEIKGETYALFVVY